MDRIFNLNKSGALADIDPTVDMKFPCYLHLEGLGREELLENAKDREAVMEVEGKNIIILAEIEDN